jgi:HEAT repeat protein
MALSELDCCHEEITSALDDNNMLVRLYAVRALGRSLRQDMIKVLVPMLKDRDKPVVYSTIDAISRIGGEEAFGILQFLMDHGEEGVREKAGEALEAMVHAGNESRGGDIPGGGEEGQ